MNMDELSEQFQKNERYASWASYFIVPLLMICLTVAIVDFIHRLVLTMDFSYLIWLSFIVSIEAMIANYRLYHIREDRPNVFLYRIVELVSILLFLKFVQYLDTGLQQIFQDIPRLKDHFLEVFFNGEFIVGGLILSFIWSLSTSFYQDLRNLSGGEISWDGTRLEAVIRDRSDSRQNIGNRIMVIGAGIIISTALVRMDLLQLNDDLTFFVSRLTMINVIVYFILALLLLSLSQFSNLRFTWTWDQVPIHRNIAKNWLFYGLIMMVIAGFVAFVLPTSYALGFLPTLGYLLSLIMNLAYYALLIIFLPFVFIFSLLQSLINDQPIQPINEVMPAIPEQFLPVAQTNITSSDFIKSILFWLIFVGLICYVIFQYFHQNRELVDKIKSIKAVRWIIQAWMWVKSHFRNVILTVPTILERTLSRIRETGKNPTIKDDWRYFRVRRLPPRDQVIFWYLALLRRGIQYGYSRKPAQTPYNYADALSSEIPDVSEEMKLLTEAFVDARYSLHDVTQENAGFVRRYWEKIRKTLYQLRKV